MQYNLQGKRRLIEKRSEYIFGIAIAFIDFEDVLFIMNGNEHKCKIFEKEESDLVGKLSLICESYSSQCIAYLLSRSFYLDKCICNVEYFLQRENEKRVDS